MRPEQSTFVKDVKWRGRGGFQPQSDVCIFNSGVNNFLLRVRLGPPARSVTKLFLLLRTLVKSGELVSCFSVSYLLTYIVRMNLPSL